MKIIKRGGSEMNKLKKLRLLKEMSQAELAQALGISQSYLSLIEADKRKINDKMNEKLKEVFGVSFVFLR